MHSDWTLPKCDDETSLYLLFLSFCGFKLFDCPFTKFQVCCDQCKHLGARIQTHDLSQMSFLFYPLDQSLCHRRLDTKIANSNPSATHTHTNQCDQIASLCFQFGPFTTMKLCPIPYIILPKWVQSVARTK